MIQNKDVFQEHYNHGQRPFWTSIHVIGNLLKGSNSTIYMKHSGWEYIPVKVIHCLLTQLDTNVTVQNLKLTCLVKHSGKIEVDMNYSLCSLDDWSQVSAPQCGRQSCGHQNSTSVLI